MSGPAPRIFGIPATAAPVVAIIRRGPSDWCHVGRWDTSANTYEPGAWFRGTIYPQKCDLSPDGRLFLYSAMKVGSDWPAGDIYEAVSRLPWLTALAAWNSGTTYTRGMHFAGGPEQSNAGVPDVGDVAGCPYGLRLNLPEQFAVERRRGWSESSATPSRESGGHWDEQRRVEMVKRHPTLDVTLHVDGRYAAFRSGDPADGPPTYWISSGDDIQVLEGVQWADWDASGRLLAAASDGRLEARSVTGGSAVEVADLSRPSARPESTPDWATQW